MARRSKAEQTPRTVAGECGGAYEITRDPLGGAKPYSLYIAGGLVGDFTTVHAAEMERARLAYEQLRRAA